MKRTLTIDTTKYLGKKVRVCGWVNTKRHHGGVVFLDLRDRSGIVQIVCSPNLVKGVKDEHILEVEGKVRKRPLKMINPEIETGEIEVKAEKIKILAKLNIFPFDIKNLKLSLPVLLDYRPLTLRNSKIKAIFQMQEEVISSFRKIMKELDFTEFQAPTIVPVATEGGAEIFHIDYYDYDAYLAQSPQLYKQIMVGVFERVFTLAHAYRAEPSVTTRHISEYISLDAEMGFIDSWEELMDTCEIVIKNIFSDLQKNYKKELKMFGATIPELSSKIPRLKMREAQEIIFKRTGRNNRREPDLEPEDEREICQWAKEKKKSELVFITHYPTEKRPFYTFADPKDPEYTLSFDLLCRGLEIVTGGQRIHEYDKLLKNIKKWGNKPKDFELYLQAFKYGMPPEGGFALGAERIVKQVLELGNIREASLFPRDMERIDQRLSVLQPEKKKLTSQTLFNRIIEFLEQKKIKFEVIEHKPVYTSEEAAKVRGTKLKQGAKAVIMFADKKPIEVVISATTKVDTKKFKKEYKIKDLRMAAPKEVKRLVEVEIGAVPPLGNLFGLKVFIDEKLLENKLIVFNAGLHTKSIKMASKDYVNIVEPVIGKFSSEI